MINFASNLNKMIDAGLGGPLDPPQTIQLTPEQLSTLAGENNIWSDAGNISLEFPYYEETEGY